MFKRLKTSISNPPQLIYYMKDSWWRIAAYILMIPLLLTLPLVLKSFFNNDMTEARYNEMILTIQEDFRIDNTEIIDGILYTDQQKTASFEYFTLNIGQTEYDQTTVNFVFKTDEIAMYLSNVEFNRKTYEELNLLNHDFSSTNIDDIRALAFALKTMFESDQAIATMDIMLTYFTGLFDYLFYITILGLFSAIFIFRAPMPFKYRFKLSVYLTTIVIFAEFIFQLFGVSGLGFISFFIGYIYHVWAYKSMVVIAKGGKPNGEQ